MTTIDTTITDSGDRTIAVGAHVRIERDETRYPPKGTWTQFRGKTGTVVEINLGEYGVIFTSVTPRSDGRGKFNYSGTITWFQPHEIRLRGGAERHADALEAQE
jgi:hypothetical protein